MHPRLGQQRRGAPGHHPVVRGPLGEAVGGVAADMVHAALVVDETRPAGQVGVDVEAGHLARGADELGEETAGVAGAGAELQTFMPVSTPSVVSSRWMTAGFERCGLAPWAPWRVR
ncbi:MAG: hypothetical protein JWQ95_911 [Sphaerisporangium sp.]|nr:hypothetical protein [Sphaerisporangium sp.]